VDSISLHDRCQLLYNLRMKRVVEGAALSPDWVVQATRHHIGLTGTAPVAAYTPERLPRGAMRIDLHQGIEVGIVLAGRHERQFEDFVMPLEPGDIWLCAMWEPHRWHVLSDWGSSLGIVFLPEFLGEERFDGISWLTLFAVRPRERPRVGTDAMRKRVLAVGEDLRREITERPPRWMTAVRLGILHILFELSRGWSPPPVRRPESKVYVSDLTKIMPALRLIQDNPAKPVRQVEAASACGLSVSGFSRIFVSTMGMSFTRFHVRARLAFAAHLLVATDSSIEAIADKAGFVDDSHLIHAFVKHYACTPGQYRRRVQIIGPDTEG